MDGQDQANEPKPDESMELEQYREIAASIGDGPSRSREGFGALQHFERIFHESVDLVIGSSFLSPPKYPDGLEWYLDHPFAGRFYRKPTPSRFFVGLLGSPSVYEPHCLWALFWALARAEHDFLFRYVPYWSHEERLTGHLVGLMLERVESFSKHWNSLDASSDSRCRMYYADTAAARNEQETGADLGLIVHGSLGGRRDFYKAIRFQAKKAGRSGSATLESEQTEALLRNKGLGYYLFYHATDANGWAVPPTVMPATAFEEEVKPADDSRSRKPSRRFTVAARDWGFDLATFITFAVADPISERGVACSDPHAAAEALFGNVTPPSRLLVITLGTPTSAINWDAVLAEYIRFGQGED